MIRQGWIQRTAVVSQDHPRERVAVSRVAPTPPGLARASGYGRWRTAHDPGSNCRTGEENDGVSVPPWQRPRKVARFKMLLGRKVEPPHREQDYQRRKRYVGHFSNVAHRCVRSESASDRHSGRSEYMRLLCGFPAVAKDVYDPVREPPPDLSIWISTRIVNRDLQPHRPTVIQKRYDKIL